MLWMVVKEKQIQSRLKLSLMAIAVLKCVARNAGDLQNGLAKSPPPKPEIKKENFVEKVGDPGLLASMSPPRVAREFLAPKEEKVERLVREGGLFGLQVGIIAKKVGVPGKKVQAILDHVGVHISDMVCEGLPINQVVIYSSQELADYWCGKVIDSAFAKEDAEIGSKRKLAVSVDGGWQKAKKSPLGVLYVLDAAADGCRVLAYVNYSKKASAEEQLLGLGKFLDSPNNMESEAIKQCIKVLCGPEIGGKIRVFMGDGDSKSGGALKAALEALGYSVAEINEIIILLDTNHFFKNSRKYVEKVMNSQAVDKQHAQPAESGGCPGGSKKSLKACSGISLDWERWRFRPAVKYHYWSCVEKIRGQLKAAKEKKGTRVTRASASSSSAGKKGKGKGKKAEKKLGNGVEQFVHMFRNGLKEALGHPFGNHSKCDPAHCGHRGDSVERATKRDSAVTCKAQKEALYAESMAYYSKQQLAKMFCEEIDGSSQKAEAMQHLGNKLAPKGKKLSSAQYVIGTALAVSSQNEMALDLDGQLSISQMLLANAERHLGMKDGALAPCKMALEAEQSAVLRRRARSKASRDPEFKARSNAARDALRRKPEGAVGEFAYGMTGQSSVRRKRDSRDQNALPKSTAALKKAIMAAYERCSNSKPEGLDLLADKELKGVGAKKLRPVLEKMIAFEKEYNEKQGGF